MQFTLSCGQRSFCSLHYKTASWNITQEWISLSCGRRSFSCLPKKIWKKKGIQGETPWKSPRKPPARWKKHAHFAYSNTQAPTEEVMWSNCVLHRGSAVEIWGFRKGAYTPLACRSFALQTSSFLRNCAAGNTNNESCGEATPRPSGRPDLGHARKVRPPAGQTNSFLRVNLKATPLWSTQENECCSQDKVISSCVWIQGGALRSKQKIT